MSERERGRKEGIREALQGMWLVWICSNWANSVCMQFSLGVCMCAAHSCVCFAPVSVFLYMQVYSSVCLCVCILLSKISVCLCVCMPGEVSEFLIPQAWFVIAYWISYMLHCIFSVMTIDLTTTLKTSGWFNLLIWHTCRFAILPFVSVCMCL